MILWAPGGAFANPFSELFYYRAIQPGPAKSLECDLAVYGGTPAGVAAAIQAATIGKRVLFFSFNKHVGGLTSGGLTATDVGKKNSIGGLAQEFYERIGRIRNFSPSAAEKLYREMLKEAGVEVLLRRCLVSVEKEGEQIVSMTMDTGETVQAKVFVTRPMREISSQRLGFLITSAESLPPPMESL